MFALHTPQSITLTTPGEDGPFTLINFRTNGADTSRCVMEIVTPEGDTHRLTFTTRGTLVDQQFIAKDNPEDEHTRELLPSEYIVDGRDTRADNPYTHVAPVDADTAYRDGAFPGHKQPPVYEDGKEVDLTEMHENAHQEAAKAARENRQKILDRMDEKPEDRAERERKERRDRLEQGFAEEDRHAEAGVGPERIIDHDFPETDPMIPAPSSGLRGGEPVHPESQPPHGVVNTTQSMHQAADRARSAS